MDSIDALVSITLFLLVFVMLQFYFPQIEKPPTMYSPFFLCAAGSPGLWYVSDGTPGMGYAYRRCELNNDRVNEFFSRISSNPSHMKELMGLSGKKVVINITSFDGSIVYYSHVETLNRPNIDRYEIPASLNSTPVKIIVEVAYR